jgi:hypothetical protein
MLPRHPSRFLPEPDNVALDDSQELPDLVWLGVVAARLEVHGSRHTRVNEE